MIKKSTTHNESSSIFYSVLNGGTEDKIYYSLLNSTIIEQLTVFFNSFFIFTGMIVTKIGLDGEFLKTLPCKLN